MSEFNEADVLEITEMLETATKNVERVYESGYKSGYGDEYNGECNVEDAGDYGKDTNYEHGYTAGFDAGVQSEYDRFWDAYQENGSKESYEAAFGGSGWNNETFKPKYPLKPTYAYNMFYACNVSDGYDVLKEADFSQCTMVNNAFAQCHFKHIGTVDFSSVKELSAVFAHTRELETIDKIIVNADHVFSSTFVNSLYLKDIAFEGEIGNDLIMSGKYNGKVWGTNLTNASITNIVEHLSDDVSGKTLTLSKEAVDREFVFRTEIDGEILEVLGTDESNPYWWPLADTKPNWTFTFVE